MSKYRQLTTSEVDQLTLQGCHCSQWNNVKVTEGFTTDRLHKVRLSGRIRLGAFDKEIELPGGLQRPTGIYHAVLHNCVVGDNVLIENVHNYIANYIIEDNAFIMNVNTIFVEGSSSFGNGVEVSVLNEVNGREVPIFNELSASLAYIMALYRHRPPLIKALRKQIKTYTESVTSTAGRIGKCAKIMNAATLRNVNIGDYARVINASYLSNGSINSNANAPVLVGDNVTAEDFIISSGATVSHGASLTRTFVGQACHVSHGFSAHDSLIFANCNFENGEACAIFAGPFTVSMHKSSLLIAGVFSFCNAGSGSNQSNHMYKLGPIHQGVLERGSKTTSDSYILWPAKIGAFSLVMGRHYRHSDTSKLPFSYLIENKDESYLVPGTALRTVGTVRDAQKWPKRDKRTDPNRLDLINFNLLSPYTVGKMIMGEQILNKLIEISGETSEIYYYQSTRIKNSSVRNGSKLYALAIDKFLGNTLISRIEKLNIKSADELRQMMLTPSPYEECDGEWVDLAGLFVPRSTVNSLLDAIEAGSLDSIEAIQQRLTLHFNNYYDMEWHWAKKVMATRYNLTAETISPRRITEIVKQWCDSVVDLDHMLYDDAKKEFSLHSKIGFGVDGSSSDQQLDFESVRGEFITNPFVQSVTAHIKSKTALAERITALMSAL